MVRAFAGIGTASFAAALLASCAAGPAAPPLPPPPAHPNGQVLWQIVHGQCVPGQQSQGKPAPCAEVDLARGEDHGFAVLKDRAGATQYLVMPTRLITGIEDTRLRDPGATNYFAPAWRVRVLVEAKLGAPLAATDTSIAVNSIYGRTQDLLHLHVDCIRSDVRNAIAGAAPGITYHWSSTPLMLAGHPYRALRIDGAEVPTSDPFDLLARGLHVPPGEMGAWTLVLAGAQFLDGRPGFVLLAGRADPASGNDGSGEELQDHDCTGRGPTAGH